MKTTIIAALFVVAIAVAVAKAQDSTGQSQMQGMMQGMGEQKSGDSGMQGMSGMMGMMKMMDQCNAMMAAHKTAEGESALDILKKRYAKGEISKDEFERMKKDVE